MATASRALRRSWWWIALVLLVGVTQAAWIATRDVANADESAPVHVRATSVFQFDTLDELVAASDLVVQAAVVGLDRGRLVGDPAAGGIVSRLVTLQPTQVLWSRVGALAGNIIVEEEGWLADGTPLVVDDLTPTEIGDRGLWFLDRLDRDEAPLYIVINSQGRFLDRDGSTEGGLRGDRLVETLSRLDVDELARAVELVASRLR